MNAHRIGAELADKEAARLRALKSYDILDTPPEEVFNEFTRLAASIVGVPVGLVSFVDGTRQWFKAKLGLDVPETPRDVAFCAHAIKGVDVLVIPNALEDERFADNPLVTGAPHIRFYAGAPLLTPDGEALGTLCVIDFVPRELTVEQSDALRILSRHVMAQLELRKRLADFTRGDAARREAIAALHRALECCEFVLHYQPQVDMRSGRITTVEALIRWNQPGHGLIGPAEFVPLMEESGLIVDVGRWVLAQATADYRSWLQHGWPVPRISVNVSPVQLRHPEFITVLHRAVEVCDQPRAELDIEITESVLMDHTAEAIEKLQDVRRMSVRVALDDFGSGYSSLRYLARLPIDILKIDRSFINAMTENPDDMAIVSSLINLGHALSLKVVAEGVENDEQRKLLRLLLCDEMQGYLYSRPLAKADLETLLRNSARDILAPVSASGGRSAGP